MRERGKSKNQTATGSLSVEFVGSVVTNYVRTRLVRRWSISTAEKNLNGHNLVERVESILRAILLRTICLPAACVRTSSPSRVLIGIDPLELGKGNRTGGAAVRERDRTLSWIFSLRFPDFATVSQRLQHTAYLVSLLFPPRNHKIIYLRTQLRWT